MKTVRSILRGQPDGVDLSRQRREMIAASHSQARLNERRESNLLSAWHSAVNPAEKGATSFPHPPHFHFKNSYVTQLTESNTWESKSLTPP